MAVQEQQREAVQGEQPATSMTFLSAIRAHRVVVLVITLAAVFASLVFLIARSPDYEATAELLVQPIPADDQTFLGLPLLRDTGDPVRTMQTAASLVESPVAAAMVANEGGDLSADEILDRIEVSPQGQSNILGVTASEEGAESAARLANRFSRAVLEARSDQIGAAAAGLIAELQAALSATPETDATTRADLGARLDQVNSVVSRGDPTLLLSQPAVPPTSAEGASSALIVVLALLAGLALGSGTAVLMELAGRRGAQGRE